eukprot:scaffold28413_cov21-Tisochrysis_lutea.AAC.1
MAGAACIVRTQLRMHACVDKAWCAAGRSSSSKLQHFWEVRVECISLRFVQEIGAGEREGDSQSQQPAAVTDGASAARATKQQQDSHKAAQQASDFQHRSSQLRRWKVCKKGCSMKAAQHCTAFQLSSRVRSEGCGCTQYESDRRFSVHESSSRRAKQQAAPATSDGKSEREKVGRG